MLSLTSPEGESHLCCLLTCALTENRYANVTLRFLTDELGFENDETCREFLESHGAQTIIEEKRDENNVTQFRVRIRDAATLFEGLRASAFRKVDIKGQI
jgi:hypothetical protein